MKFTEEEIPLMKLIFNPETHDMRMLVGGKRAKDIFEYVCEENELYSMSLFNATSYVYRCILINKNICNFFWDNNILNTRILNDDGIYFILSDSPIAEKIWDSGKLDLTKLGKHHTRWLLKKSPIEKKIWDSGKINTSLLTKEEIEYFKQKFDSI